MLDNHRFEDLTGTEMTHRTVPKLSIVVPSYNQGGFLERTIKSIVQQDDPNLELIIIDGGSTDQTVDIIRHYEARVSYWQSRPDGGQTDALNQGLSRCTGEYVGWINSDDLYLLGSFTTARTRFDEEDRPDVVFGDIVIIDADGQPIREARHDVFSVEALAQLGLDMNQQAMFWRRTLHRQILPLDTSLTFCMDLELVLRLAASKATFARVRRFMGAFRRHADSKTSHLERIRVEEQARLLAQFREGVLRGHRLPSRTLMHIGRRLRFLFSGDWRYGLLGGVLGLSADARRAVMQLEP